MALSVPVRVPIAPGVFGQFQEQLKRAIQEGIVTASYRIEREALPLMPQDTGALKASFSVEPNPTGVVLSWDVPYASVADFGAPPHTISASSSQFLVFKDSRTGQWVKKTEVNHPGYQGHFYSFTVQQLAAKIMSEEIAKAIEKIRVVA